MRRGGQGGRGQRFSKDSVMESAGPNGKIRGNAQQLVDRYVSFGKDALSQRDFTEAENYFQHAEHYRRLALTDRAQKVPARDGHKGGQPVLVGTSEESALEDATEELPSFVVDDAPQIQDDQLEKKPIKTSRARKPRAKREPEVG